MIKKQDPDIFWGIIRHGYISLKDFTGKTHKIPLGEADIDPLIEKLKELKEGLKSFQKRELNGGTPEHVRGTEKGD